MCEFIYWKFFCEVCMIVCFDWLNEKYYGCLRFEKVYDIYDGLNFGKLKR